MTHLHTNPLNMQTKRFHLTCKRLILNTITSIIASCLLIVGSPIQSMAQCATAGAEPTLVSGVAAPSVCFQEVAAGIGLGAGSRKIYSGFSASTAYQLRMNPNGALLNCVQVRWVDNSNNPISGWSAIDFSGSNGNASSVTSPAGATRLEVTTGSAGWSGTSAVLNYRTPPPNTGLPFGSNTWNVYAFSHSGYNFANMDLNGNTHTYQGYYSDGNIDINSPGLWADQPSQAPGYQGCAPGVDNHTVVYKRQGFPCREYQIDLDGHDDGVQCYVNGVLVYSLDGCCADRGVIWQGVLGSTSTVEFRQMEGGGGSNLNVNFIEVDSWSVAANASPTTLCQGSNIALTSSISGTTPQFRNTVDVGVPDNTCINSYINVISSLNANQISSVILNIPHTFTADLDITLVAPNGSATALALDRGGNGDGYSNATLQTGGATLPTGNATISGVFSPEQPFSNLTGSANGMWRLQVCDDAGSDVGTLTEWQINFSTTTYSWTGPNSYSNATQNPTITGAVPAQSGTYTASISSQGCTASGNTPAVTVRPTPTATIGGTTTVCQGATSPNITFNNPQTLPVTINYNINGAGSFNVNVNASASATVAVPTGAAGSFAYNLVSVAYQAAPTCSSPVSGAATVTVSATPTLGSLSTPGPVNFCASNGDFGTGLSVTGQTGTVTWEWGTSNGNWNAWTTGSPSPTCCFPKKVAVSDGNADRIRYYVTQPGCSNTSFSSTVLIQNRFNEAPNNTLTPSQNNYCSGSVANMTLSVTFPTPTNILGTVDFYSGSCGGTLVASVPGNGTTTVTTPSIAAPTSTTNYFVRYNPGTGTGCSPTACQTTTVTVIPSAISATLNTKTPNTASVCLGTNVNATINAGSGGGVGATDTYEYSINGGSSWSSYVSGNTIATGSASGSVQVRVSRSGCNPTSPTVIATWNIDPLPGSVSVNTSGTYCASTTINATGGSGGTMYYQGTTSGGTSTATPSSSQLITSSGTYYFRAQSGAGCWGPEGSAAITIQTPINYYADVDGDGFGNAAVSVSLCAPPPGFVTDNTDCNDGNNTAYPGALEVCDGVDNNCNGSTDEGVLITFYEDVDGDGFGNPAVSFQACIAPGGYVTDNTDCNDGNNTVYTGAPEICDGLDNNCNGSTDEGVLITFYADNDGDGLGDPNVSTQACSAPGGYVTDNTDCDDNNSVIYPIAVAQNINAYLDASGMVTVTGAQVNNGSSAACGIASMSVYPNSFTCSNIGNNNVDFTVRDMNGDSATVSAVITVIDTIDPAIVAQNLTIQLDGFGNASITPAQIDNGSSDACGILSTMLSQTNFTCADVGNNTVTLTVTDVNSNVSTVDVTVTVEDLIAPTATAQNITVQLDNTGNVTITGAQVNNGSSDNCSIASLDVSPNAFTCASLGNNNVTLTVTDVNGNISTAPAVVTVQAMTFPPITASPLSIAINPGQFIVYTGSTSLGTLNWYNASNVLVGTGNTYTTPVLPTATTFSVKSNIAGCESPSIPLIVTLKPVTTFGGRKAN